MQILSDYSKKFLLGIARKKIESKINKENYTPDIKRIENIAQQEIRKPLGVFVSLHKKTDLRGCIGLLRSDQPLYQSVMEMAYSAAFNDPRFDPVKQDELGKITIEISVISPMKKIINIDEIELGKHGIYITNGYQTGTFLPQVVKQTNWSMEEFLGHCSKDKAGIGWEGWKNADIYIYETIIFTEDQY